MEDRLEVSMWWVMEDTRRIFVRWEQGAWRQKLKISEREELICRVSHWRGKGLESCAEMERLVVERGRHSLFWGWSDAFCPRTNGSNEGNLSTVVYFKNSYKAYEVQWVSVTPLLPRYWKLALWTPEKLSAHERPGPKDRGYVQSKESMWILSVCGYFFFCCVTLSSGLIWRTLASLFFTLLHFLKWE